MRPAILHMLIAAGALTFLYGSVEPPPVVATIPQQQQSDETVVVHDLQSGQPLVLLNRREQIRYGEFVWDDTGPRDGPLWIRVDLKTQIVSVFRGRREIGTAVMLYGSPGKPTPAGEFSILRKFETHRSSIYGSDMPYTLRLTDDGISIHASDVQPTAATHGCIGLPSAFAKLLFEQASVGDRVLII